MPVLRSRYARAGGVAAFAALVLSACTVVVEDGPSPLPPRPGPIICTQEYAPVCGRRGGTARTFGNACEARASGYDVAYRGECRRAEAPQFCTREYRPVCARRGPDRRTFGNACEAEAESYRILYEGRC